MALNTQDDVTVALLVPRRLVKAVKTILEGRKRLSRNSKIKPTTNGTKDVAEERCIIPAILPWTQYQSFKDSENSWEHTLVYLGLGEYRDRIDKSAEYSLELVNSSGGTTTSDATTFRSGSYALPGGPSALANVFNKWLETLSKEALQKCLDADASSVRRQLQPASSSYSIYSPLLLLPSNFFSEWPSEFLGEAFRSEREDLFRRLCHSFSVTHIALNGSIANGVRDADSMPTEDSATLRLPAGFMPVFGDFGPMLDLCRSPKDLDFERAFWCKSRQHGILQTWAPRYSMFSRGNISEKARIQHLASLKADRLDCLPHETSAVDMYAGIGYFAFSYAKVGVSKVLCWEINPWSIEGLRRGAAENGWQVTSYSQGDRVELDGTEPSRIVSFHESNQEAVTRVMGIRDVVNPIRHVNCGYLPTSKGSWESAVEILDPVLGGWIHAHENVEINKIGSRETQIVEIFRGLILESPCHMTQPKQTVKCEHIEKVKSYAPGVIHCVFDIAVSPTLKPE